MVAINLFVEYFLCKNKKYSAINWTYSDPTAFELVRKVAKHRDPHAAAELARNIPEFNLIGNHFIVTYYFRLTCILEQTIELNTVCNNITENIVIECGTLLFMNIDNRIYLTT